MMQVAQESHSTGETRAALKERILNHAINH
nr:MAG TPA: hypothetical protein [Caudoviricetes sp.]